MTSAQSDALNAAEREAATSSTSPPDWSTCDLELECPRCGYNLHGLTGSRCPECGLELNWSAIVKATANFEHVPLFEYQWRTRPIRSLLRSLLMSVLPWWTWKQIPLTSKPRIAALVVQPFLVMLLSYPLLVTFVVAGQFAACLKYRRLPAWQSLNYAIPWNPIDGSELVRQYSIGITLFLFMSTLHQTLARCRIRHGHLLRISVFAVLTLDVRRVATPILESAVHYYMYSYRSRFGLLFIFAAWDLLFIALIAWVIASACADYLRIPNAWPVALTVTALAALFWITTVIGVSVLLDTWNNWLVELWESSWLGIGGLVDWAFKL